MTKLIAILAISSLMFLNTLGNFWFTYGIWPRSWVAFFGFWASALVLYNVFNVVRKEDK